MHYSLQCLDHVAICFVVCCLRGEQTKVYVMCNCIIDLLQPNESAIIHLKAMTFQVEKSFNVQNLHASYQTFLFSYTYLYYMAVTNADNFAFNGHIQITGHAYITK